MPSQPDGNNNHEQHRHWLDRLDRSDRTHGRRGPSGRERAREQTFRDWYGPGLAEQEITARRRPPRKTGDILNQVLAEMAPDSVGILTELQEKWPSIVGKQIADVARPVAVKKNTCYVEVSHSAWLYVLKREHKSTLEEKVKHDTDGKVVSVQLIPKGRYSDRK